MNRTAIEWTEMSWSPVTGCTPVSEGCAHCYARRMAQRLRGRFGYPEDEPFRVTLHPERLKEPLKLKKPARIFACSMGDLFHPDVEDLFILDVFNVMAASKRHIFLVLTKRPDRMRDFCQRLRHGLVIPGPRFSIAGKGCGPGQWREVADNIWLGVSVENQAAADERIPLLVQTPAAVRFVSAEPLLGPVDLGRLVWFKDGFSDPIFQEQMFGRRRLDWIICGGETGPGARPMHPEWVRGLRDQAVAAGIPFFFKGWGAWVPVYADPPGSPAIHELRRPDGTPYMVRAKARDRLLDGREWSDAPAVTTGMEATT